ncbi:MAG: DUF2147 domain-containing protein [Sphingomicrobium sp.]
MPLILALLLTAAQAAPPSIEGQWRSPGGNSIIAIAPCGSMLCGTVAWASAQAKEASRKTVAQLVGTQLLTGLEQRTGGHWQGRLFIPDKNMRVTAKIQLISAAQLKVSGCAAGRALCRSAVWTRADEPLPSAD